MAEETLDEIIDREDAKRKTRKQKQSGKSEVKMPLTDEVYDSGIRRVDLDAYRELLRTGRKS